MRFRRSASILGAAAAVAGVGLGAGVTGTAAAAPAATAAGTTGLVAQTQTVGSAQYVGTTTITPGATGGGSAALPSSVPPGSMPRTPDVGDTASVSGTAHSSSLSRSQAHAPANAIYPSVAASAVTGAGAGLVSAAGLSGADQGATHPTGPGQPGLDIEPPDQGVCSNGTDTLELNNMVAEVFKGSSLAAQGAASLESFFGTPEVFGAGTGPTYSVQGDPRCFYDPATQRWFASQLWLDLNDATSQFGWAGTFLAVSNTSSPVGSWKVYFVPDATNSTGTATCNNEPASSATANPCFGDQPLLGVDGSSVQISTNEYSIFGAAPNGQANLYFLSKQALVNGKSSIPTRWVDAGALPAPGAGPWYSLAPAQAPNGRYDTANGGTSYALSSLDFTGGGDQRIAEWAYTNTSAVDTAKGQVDIYEQTLASGAYGMAPAYAAQKAGPTPLGDNWNAITGSGNKGVLPEGGLATNDDRMGTATVDPVTGALIGALNTGVNQQSATGSSTRTLTGIAYFVVSPAMTSAGLAPSSVTTGYISPNDADAMFPAAAVGSAGKGLIAYSMSGTGYYPSSAYSTVAAGDAVDPTTRIARAGVGPQDGFSEYQSSGTAFYRPRWGDYSEAVANGSTVTFATEMINQSCTDSQFAADFTCGGTRDLFANWGTSVDSVTP